MTPKTLAAVLLIALPISYNVLYTLLSRSFDYPDILRRPTDEILRRFSAGGNRLILTWWGFAMTAVLLAPTVILVSATFADANATVLTLATTIGVLAALVQFLGLIHSQSLISPGQWPTRPPPHLRRAPSMSSSKHSTVISASQSGSISATCSPGFGPGSSDSPSSSQTCWPRPSELSVSYSVPYS